MKNYHVGLNDPRNPPRKERQDSTNTNGVYVRPREPYAKFPKKSQSMMQKPFGNRLRVSRSKIDFRESELKNKWPNHFYEI